MTAKRHLLLTGAGFSKNFGAPLAAELWSIILGSPFLGDYPKVLDVLRDDFDFESVYDRVQTGDFTFDERAALTKSIQQAYAYIDSAIQDTSSAGINIYRLNEMIARFAGDRVTPGFIFTLNQDLFLERHYNRVGVPRPSLPGVRSEQRWFSANFASGRQATDVSMLPSDPPPVDELIKDSGFHYVKLHGSMNWYSSVGSGQKLVLGRTKDAQISGEPLLARYSEMFRSALSTGDRKLLVIGYSFGDSNINRVLIESMKTGLQLFVLSPGSPKNLKDRLKQQGCEQLWPALFEYFAFDLKTLFPAANQPLTPQWKHVASRFFDVNPSFLI